MNKCDYCYRDLQPGSYECPSCGAPVSQNTIKVSNSSGRARKPLSREDDRRTRAFGCLVLIILCVALALIFVLGRNDRFLGKTAQTDLLESVLQIETEQAESYMSLLREAGVIDIQAVEKSRITEDDMFVYSVVSSQGGLVLYLDEERNLVEIWSDKVNAALYQDGELVSQFVALPLYRSRMQEILDEYQPGSTVHLNIHDTWGWTDFDKTRLRSEVYTRGEGFQLFEVILDVEENPLYLVIGDVEYIK